MAWAPIKKFFGYDNALVTVAEALAKIEVSPGAGKVTDLRVEISAADASDCHYRISVTNTGKRRYGKLFLGYHDVLLYAERFSIDTTHMPREEWYIDGEPVFIEALEPGQTVQVVRSGYGTHGRYDGPRQAQIMLVYESEGRTAALTDRRWCYAIVKLPNARP